jgi:hypothetical protein
MVYIILYFAQPLMQQHAISLNKTNRMGQAKGSKSEVEIEKERGKINSERFDGTRHDPLN